MKQILTVLLALVLFSNAYAQVKIEAYYNKANKEVSVGDSSAYYMVTYFQNSKSQKVGDYIEKYVNGGHLKEKGVYKNGARIGIWKEWYENKQLKREYGFESDRYWAAERLLNYWSAEGEQLVKDGTGHYISKHDNDSIAWDGWYKNSKKVGMWSYKLEDGFLRHKENYTEQGVKGVTYLLKEEQATYHKKAIEYDELVGTAMPIGGVQAFFRFIRKNLKYPKDAKRRGEKGKVLLEFIVGTDGKINNINAIRGVYPSLDAEAVRILKIAPKWTPSTYRGLPEKQKMRFPINFSTN